MMNKELQVWSPMLSELNRFHSDIDELFDRWFGSRMGNGTGNGVLNPALESFVADGKLVVRVDLPGIEPKDVEVMVTGKPSPSTASASSAAKTGAATGSVARSITAASSARSSSRRL
jgi:HSP20 family molecular chaperone IbpA